MNAQRTERIANLMGEPPEQPRDQIMPFRRRQGRPIRLSRHGRTIGHDAFHYRFHRPGRGTVF